MRLAVAGLLLAAGPAAAQQTLPTRGSELFRGVLHRLNYVPDTAGPPQVVIVIGRPFGSAAPVAALCRQTLDAGGAVLVSTTSFPGLSDCFPTRPGIASQAVQPTLNSPRSLAPPLAEKIGTIRASRPRAGSGLRLEVPNDVAVEWPLVRLTTTDPNDPWVGTPVAEHQSSVVFAVGGISPRPRRPGRALVLASDAVFSNAFLAGRYLDETETGNLQFALNVARWLRPAGDGPVTCRFVENGRVVERFDEVDYAAVQRPQLPTPGPPPLSAFLKPEAQAKLTDAANEAFDRVQSDDRFNAALTSPGRFGKLLHWLLGGLALLVAVALVRRARAARRPTESAPPAAPPRPAGPFAQRREELLRTGDHTAAVREYLVDLFRHHGLPLDQYRHPTRMPRVEADAATRRRVATLWEAAYGPHPISYSRWKELEPMIEAVRADEAAGRWRFAGGRA